MEKTSVHLLSAFKLYIYITGAGVCTIQGMINTEAWNPPAPRSWAKIAWRVAKPVFQPQDANVAGGPAAGKVSSVRLFMSVRRKNAKIILWATNSGNVERIWKVPPQNKTTGAPQKSQGRQRSVRLLLKMIELFWNGCIFPNSHWLLKKFQWAVSLFGRLLEEPLDAVYRWCHQECFGEYSPRVDNLQVIYTIWYPQSFTLPFWTFTNGTAETYLPLLAGKPFPFLQDLRFFGPVTKSQPQKMTLETVHSQT